MAKGRVHLENLGKVMETSIKENPTHFFGNNGRLMSLKKLTKAYRGSLNEASPNYDRTNSINLHLVLQKIKLSLIHYLNSSL